MLVLTSYPVADAARPIQVFELLTQIREKVFGTIVIELEVELPGRMTLMKVTVGTTLLEVLPNEWSVGRVITFHYWSWRCPGKTRH